MTILAIDTTTQWCSVALFSSKERFIFRHEQVGSGASLVVLKWLEELLAQAQLSWSHIDAITVSQGPGAFTGIRLGIGIAQGLALAQTKPLIPIPSLDGMMAWEFFKHPETFHEDRVYVGLLDARMGELYTAPYQIINQELKRTQAISLQALTTFHPEPHSHFFMHDPIKVLESVRTDATSCFYPSSPHALGIALCALQQNTSEPFLVQDCQPLYIRDHVALTTLERASK